MPKQQSAMTLGNIVRALFVALPFSSGNAFAGQYRVCNPSEAEQQPVCTSGEKDVWCYDVLNSSGKKWGLSCHKTEEKAEKSLEKAKHNDEVYARFFHVPVDTRYGPITCKGCVLPQESAASTIYDTQKEVARQMIDEVTGSLQHPTGNLYGLLDAKERGQIGSMYGMYDIVTQNAGVIGDYAKAMDHAHD